jgi:hypothetical protein
MRPRAQTALAARRLQVRNCYWVAVPRQLYAQRLNNRSDLPQRFHPGRVRRFLWPPRMHARRVNDAPCPPLTSHGASIMLQCGARRHPITTAASENLCHCFGLLIMKYHGCVAGGAPATVDRCRRHKRVRNNAPHRLLTPALALRLLRNTPIKSSRYEPEQRLRFPLSVYSVCLRCFSEYNPIHPPPALGIRHTPASFFVRNARRAEQLGRWGHATRVYSNHRSTGATMRGDVGESQSIARMVVLSWARASGGATTGDRDPD